jgi:AraC-like DNA-binding protein
MGILLIVLLLLTSIPNDIRSIALNTCLCLGLVAANFFLFFKPEILYGLPQPLSSNMEVANTDDLHHADTENTKDINKVESDAIPGFIYEYKAKVDSFLKKSKRYLDSEFNIQDLSREMGLPKHHLQLYIYKVENKGFIEFINDYKISHLKSMIDKGELSKKTLVALASECGFSSKATFFRTIKKKTGKTPLEYFNSSN